MITHTSRRRMSAFALPLACLAVTACSDFTTEVHRVPQDHPTIQAALDAADGADIISIAPGVYRERLTIDYTPYLTIRGKGDVVIDAGGGFNAVTATGNIALKLRGLRITNAVQAGLRLDDCTDVTIDGCTIDDVQRFGLHIVDSTRVKFTNSTVRATEIAGVYLDDTRPPNEVTIEDCEIRDAGRHGLFLHGDLVTVRRTRISDVTNNGVVCRSTETLLEGVRVQRSAGEGILSTAAGTTFRRCRVEDAAFSGFVATQTGAVFERCVADGIGRVAFSAQGDAARIVRCRATRTGLSAIQVLGADTLVKRCIVRGAGVLHEAGPDTAAVFVRGAQLEAVQCRIFDTAGDGIRIASPGALVRGNRVQRAGRVGLVLAVGGNEVVKNRVKNCAGGPLRDDAPGENVLDRNQLGARR